MAENKSKDEVKADIVDKEAENASMSQVKKTEKAVEKAKSKATKPELLKEAKALKLDVSAKNTVAEIKAALKGAQNGSNQEATETEAEASQEQSQVATAKAGKRSAKAIKEAEEAQAKEARKADESDEDEKPKQKHNPPRSRLERRGKGYQKSAEKVDNTKMYTLEEALALAIDTSHVKFDATVELHARLNVDPRQADQNIRDTVVLPAGTGKTIRVAVFAEDDQAKAAKAAGADVAGNETFLQQLDKEDINFDVLIATPSVMPKLGKYARLLGPKGLMPNPKSGTVTTDIEKAVNEAKAGKVEYRVDSTGIVHVGIGKVSFGKAKLLQNARALAASIKGNKPSSIKGAYVKSVYITSAMGPSMKVEASELQ